MNMPHDVAQDEIKHLRARIEALETALREIKDQYLAPEQSSAIARKALAPARQENDDVFPGFRGNNDYA
jgi:hypothetical protein